MLSGKPLFPGRDYHHQLTLILDVLGTPTLDEFYAITTRRSRDYIRALPFRKKKSFQTIFPNANPLAIDFLTKTLVYPHFIGFGFGSHSTPLFSQTFDPKKRITVEQALAHPYLESYVRECGYSDVEVSLFLFFCQHDPDDEPVAPPLDPEFFEFDCRWFLFLLGRGRMVTIKTVHKDDISREQLKELLYEEITSFKAAI